VQIYAKTAKSQNLSIQIGMESKNFPIFAKIKRHLIKMSKLFAPY